MTPPLWLAKAVNESPRGPSLDRPAHASPGELWLCDDPLQSVSSALVLVLSSEEVLTDEATATIALVDEDYDLATDTGLVFAAKDTTIGRIAVEAMLVGTVWKTQLAIRIGKVTSPVLDAVRSVVNGGSPIGVGATAGTPLQQGDVRWGRRYDQMALMSRLTDECEARLLGDARTVAPDITDVLGCDEPAEFCLQVLDLADRALRAETTLGSELLALVLARASQLMRDHGDMFQLVTVALRRLLELAAAAPPPETVELPADIAGAHPDPLALAAAIADAARGARPFALVSSSYEFESFSAIATNAHGHRRLIYTERAEDAS